MARFNRTRTIGLTERCTDGTPIVIGPWRSSFPPSPSWRIVQAGIARLSPPRLLFNVIGQVVAGIPILKSFGLEGWLAYNAHGVCYHDVNGLVFRYKILYFYIEGIDISL